MNTKDKVEEKIEKGSLEGVGGDQTEFLQRMNNALNDLTTVALENGDILASLRNIQGIVENVSQEELRALYEDA